MLLKKSQGLPLNLIIIAVIALIVLVIIIAIFAGKIGIFGKGVSDCKTKKGECKDSAKDCKPSEAPVSGLCGENKVCCIAI